MYKSILFTDKSLVRNKLAVIIDSSTNMVSKSNGNDIVYLEDSTFQCFTINT